MSKTDNNPIRRAMMLAPMMAFERADGTGIYSLEPQAIRGVLAMPADAEGKPTCKILVQTGETEVRGVPVRGDALKITQAINGERSDFLVQLRNTVHG